MCICARGCVFDCLLQAFQTEADILAAEAAQSREKALAAFRDFFNMRLRLMNVGV